MKLYTLYDRVAMSHADTGVFGFRSDDVAKRSIKQALNSKALAPTIVEYPADFDLVRLGVLNEKSGIIDSQVETIVNLGLLVEEKNDVRKDS